MEQVNQAPQNTQAQPVLPILIIYHQQLDTFKQQRDMAKLQFDQLNGAIFACEQMIKQYEDNAKAATADFAQKAIAGAEGSLKPVDSGAINHGEADRKAKKQVAKK